MRAEAYHVAALRLHDHLDGQLSVAEGYPEAPSWGYAFSVLLSAAIGEGQLTPLGGKALAHLQRQDHSDPNYSWEFVVYAMQQAGRELGGRASLPLSSYRAKGTRMFNWFLLRQLNRSLCDGGSLTARLKLQLARSLFTNKDGLILDEWRTRSLQYHAFCLFLLCELRDQYRDWCGVRRFLEEWLEQGVHFSIRQVLQDGTALWIGRGQEQIFGYGALLYAMEYVHRHVTPLPIVTIESLWLRLLSFQRPDGSFPLVLRRREPEPPKATFADQPPGWYGYNTLYDYQPFLAYTLCRSARLLRGSAKT